jgi:Holliday junction resolvasome RuvABC endonuclease subunit
VSFDCVLFPALAERIRLGLPIRILGLDPATRFGWAWNDGIHRVQGAWHLKSADKPAELNWLLRKTIGKLGVDVLAFEDAAGGTKYWQTALFHAELRAIIKLVAQAVGVPTVAVNPNTLKKWATGHGRAGKPEMIRKCKTILHVDTDDDNIADACFVEDYARQYLKHPELFPEKKPKPKKQRRKSPQVMMF